MEILERDLPLFPLNTVLFPQMPLPLHVFEERYREMIRFCLEEQVAFGVLLIRSGQEVGPGAIPMEVGTAARILEVQRFDDGRMNVSAQGLVRFRLLGYREEKGYLTGDIEIWEDDLGDALLLKKATSVARALFRQYAEQVLSLAGDQTASITPRLFRDPQVLSYAIGATVQIDTREKQQLLEVPDVARRLAREVAVLQRENEILRREAEARARLIQEDSTTYRN